MSIKKHKEIVLKATELRGYVESKIPAVAKDFPVDAVISTLDDFEKFGSYTYIPKFVLDTHRKIEETYGSNAATDYNRLILLALIEDYEARFVKRCLPEKFHYLIADFLSLVIRDVEVAKPAHFSFHHDRYLKNLAVCRQKMIPCGPVLLDIAFGALARRFLLLRPFSQVPSRLLFVLFKLHTTKQLFEIHMDVRLVGRFSPKGFANAYFYISQLMVLFPHIRGVMLSGSWFFDPAIERISPELAYLRKMPQSNGALLIPTGDADATVVKDATRFSPIRSKLYKMKQYKPQCFMLIWPREALNTWSRGTTFKL